MSGLWRVTADLERVGDVRMIHYRVGKVSDFAYPTFDIVLFWCKAACDELLSDLQRKQADEKDLEYVKREIEFLEGTQADWESKRKKW